MKLRFRLLTLAIVAAVMLGTFGGVIFAQRAGFSAPVLVVNTSFLNVRVGPGTQYEVLITVVGGTTLPVLGAASDGVWYQVSTIVGTGWVNSQLTLPRGDFANVPLVEAPSAVFNALPGSGGMGTLPGTGNVGTSGSTGMPTRGVREWGVSVLIDHPLRTQPSINGAEVTFLNPEPGIIYTVTGATSNEGVNWVRVSVPGTPGGWLEETKVRFRPFACELSAVVLTQDVSLKQGPDGTGGDKDQFIAAGAEAYLLNRANDLYQIETINGSIGWISQGTFEVRDKSKVTSEYCTSGGSFTATPSTGSANGLPGTGSQGSDIVSASVPHVVVNTGNLNIRSGPGAQFSTVATVPGGTKLSVLGLAPDGVWYYVTGTFGQGWLNSEFVLFRGDGRFLPIIRGATGDVAKPTASVNVAITLYAAPNLTLGMVGTLNPGAYDVVARTSDFLWVQLNTPLGFGWVQRDFVTIGGDTSAIPVVGG